MMPERIASLATTMAGMLALSSRRLSGRLIGGYLTETYSWHWIFLINIFPGLLVAAMVSCFVAAVQARIWRS